MSILEVCKVSAVSNHKNHYWWAVYCDGKFYQGCWLTRREAVQSLKSTERIWKEIEK